MKISLLKQPSAYLPLVMSTFVILMFLYFLLFVGVKREADEGIAAHLFQLLMGGQIPIIIYFVFTWLPKKPKEALLILELQFLAAFIACFPVFYFNL